MQHTLSESLIDAQKTQLHEYLFNFITYTCFSKSMRPPACCKNQIVIAKIDLFDEGHMQDSVC